LTCASITKNSERDQPETENQIHQKKSYTVFPPSDRHSQTGSEAQQKQTSIFIENKNEHGMIT
jgi:hypothetical protein